MKDLPVKKTKRSKAKVEKGNHTLKLINTQYKWDGQSFPYAEETYHYGEQKVLINNYVSTESLEFEPFLLEVLHHSTLPKWIKKNLQEMKKKLKDELKHREKLKEKLSQEQQEVFQFYYEDEDFFDRSEAEFLELELDKACTFFIKALLNTQIYISFCRRGLRKRKVQLKNYDRL